MTALSDANRLLRWYDRNHRILPWREETAEPDPYRVLVSEVMLQQTTARVVGPYYQRFCTHFPTIGKLAMASEPDVLALWAGLGYYSRARRLVRAARTIASEGFPREPEALQRLPGVGSYTAAAIAAIAFHYPIIPIDTNVTRVLVRRTGITEPIPQAMARVRLAARKLGTEAAARRRPGDFAQALFDLGATVCTARAPRCSICPWRARCAAYRLGIAEQLPAHSPRKPRPRRYGAHFWLADASGRILLRRRPETGPLAGMTELPGTQWRDHAWSREEALKYAPMRARWREAGRVEHGFTHFALSIALYSACVGKIDAQGFVCTPQQLAKEALPSLMRKCIQLMEP